MKTSDKLVQGEPSRSVESHKQDQIPSFIDASTKTNQMSPFEWYASHHGVGHILSAASSVVYSTGSLFTNMGLERECDELLC